MLFLIIFITSNPSLINRRFDKNKISGSACNLLAQSSTRYRESRTPNRLGIAVWAKPVNIAFKQWQALQSANYEAEPQSCLDLMPLQARSAFDQRQSPTQRDKFRAQARHL
jgi:hypothetical protein